MNPTGDVERWRVPATSETPGDGPAADAATEPADAAWSGGVAESGEVIVNGSTPPALIPVAGAPGAPAVAGVTGTDAGMAPAARLVTGALVVTDGGAAVTGGAGGGAGASCAPHSAAYDTTGGATRVPLVGDTAHPCTVPALGVKLAAPKSL
jgi:hypothetical protein